MVTGVECAGLALAVLPLFIEVAKAYSDGVEVISNVVIKRRWEERLEDFYLDFYIQLFYVEEVMQRLREVVEARPHTAQNLPKSTRLISDWYCNPKFEGILKEYLQTDQRFHAFTTVCTKILMLLSRLVKDDTNRIYPKDQKCQAMFEKLKKLALAKELRVTKSSFAERFIFFKHEAKRTECLKKLKEYVKHLIKVTDQTELRSRTNANNGTLNLQHQGQNGGTPPPIDLQHLIASLHPTLQNHYCRCPCQDNHDIKLCLRDTYKSADLRPSLDVDFLFSKDFSSPTTQDSKWQEGNVLITSQRKVHITSKRCLNNRSNLNVLDKLCDAFISDIQGFSVAFILETSRGHELMKRLQHKPRRLNFSESSAPISLGELLEGPTKLDPIEKRRLALIFAESLLLYHDSNWLQPGWLKDDICFFFKSEDEPDLKNPFLSARLNIPKSGRSLTGSFCYHANPSILALGVLLIEIFNERAIEKWKTAKEKSNPNPATVQIVTDRVVKKMDESSTTKAIQACLSLDWVPAGRSTGLEDPEIRTGFLENVIWPIKEEIHYLSVNKIF